MGQGDGRREARSEVLRALSLALVLTLGTACAKTEDAPTAPASATAFDAPPAWAQDAIWYQIMVERFRNGDPDNDPTLADVQPGFLDTFPDSWTVTDWGHDWYAPEDWVADFAASDPGNAQFNRFAQLRRYGGDLQGVLDKLDYVADLGVTAIYFNPLNDAPSLHKYDARHYRHVDRNFGPDPRGDVAVMGLEDPLDPTTWRFTSADSLFLAVVNAAHERGMRVIVDYSWNHTGTDFWAWRRARADGADGALADWYDVEHFDDPATPEDEFAYTGWLGVPSLPEFAEDNGVFRPERYGESFIKPVTGDFRSAALREHIFSVTRRWLDPNGDGDPSDGVDGFRLDVAVEVGMDFWRDYRRVVRAVNPDAYLCGEVWYATWPDDIIQPAPYLQGDMFDGVMNYLKFRLLRGTLARRAPLVDVAGFGDSLLAIERGYRPEFARAMMNVLATHDSPRLVTSVANDNAYKYHASPTADADYDITRPDEDAYARAELLTVAQYLSVGAPHIWQGEELGMWGADDPENRKPMWWPDVDFEDERSHPSGKTRDADAVGWETQTVSSLRGHGVQGPRGRVEDRRVLYRELAALRAARPELRRGRLEVLESGHADVLRWQRVLGADTTEVWLNASGEAVSVEELRDGGGSALRSQDGGTVLNGWGYVVQ